MISLLDFSVFFSENVSTQLTFGIFTNELKTYFSKLIFTNSEIFITAFTI